MKTFAGTLLLVALLLTGCASIDSRIRRNQAAFDLWPDHVQEAIRKGEVLLGFTPAQVRVALGEPPRVYARTSVEGEAEVWAYDQRGWQFSIGVGISTGGYNSVGAGATTDRRHERSEDAVRIVFEDGKVTSVEVNKRGW